MTVVTDKYCQIVEKDSATVSVIWKATHLASLFTAALCSLVTVINFQNVIKTYGRRCVLYPKLNFSDEFTYGSVGSIPTNVSFHNSLTIWGAEKICAYVNCTYLFSMVLALIMFFFFVIVPKGGHSKNIVYSYAAAWKFVPIAFCLSLVITICISFAYVHISNGLSVFSQQIYDHLRSETDFCITENCNEGFNMYTLLFNAKEKPVATEIKIITVTASIALVAWVVLLTSLLIRMFLGVDFTVAIYHLRLVGELAHSRSSGSSLSYYPDDEIPPMKKRKMEKKQSHKLKSSDEEENLSDDNIL